MADDTDTVKPEAVNAALGDMKLEEGGDGRPSGSNGSEAVKRSPSGTPGPSNAWSQSPAMKQSASQTPKSEDDDREIIGADITVTAQPGKAPKLIRKATQKVESHTPALFLDVDDATEEACSVFTKIKDCIYGSKHLGSTDNDVLDCDCAQEWSMFIPFSCRISRFANGDLQAMAQIMPVARTQTVSIVRLKWSVWTGIIAVGNAKTNGFSANNTPMSL